MVRIRGGDSRLAAIGMWNYNAKDYNERVFELIPVGSHRVRIEKTEDQKSKKSGKDMIKLELKVSGYYARLFHYIVLDPANAQFTNQQLGSLFNSFGIPPGDMNHFRWIGKTGAAKIRHREYEGETLADIAYFIPKSGQNELQPWREGGSVISRTPADLIPLASPSYPNMSSMRDDSTFNTSEEAEEAEEMSDCPF